MGSQRGETRNIVAGKGLHKARKDVRKKYMKQQCEQLINCWPAMLARTVELAPTRHNDFKLSKANGGCPDITSKEYRWERSLWNIWGPEIVHPRSDFVPHLCKAIQTYQCPLQQQKKGRKKNSNAGWGKIDLVGYQKTKRPVLIELKEPGSDDEPLHAIMEIAAYGVAFKKAWEDTKGELKQEWKNAVGGFKGMDKLGTLDLLVAAPKPYWKYFSKEISNCKKDKTV